MTNGTGLNHLSIPLEQWKDEMKAKPLYYLAESAINPVVRILADNMLKNRSFKAEENCLYWGEMGKVHASVSPYLLKLDDWQNFEDNIAFQSNWGVMIQLKEEVAQSQCSSFYLLNHLREWTLVTPYQQEPLLLRLSDWDVLNVLLSASNNIELNALFGPVEAFAYWHKENADVEVVSLRNPSSETVTHRSPQFLSEKQSMALNAYANRHQYKKYAEHLKAHHSEVTTWTSEAMTAFLARHIEQANQHKFTTEKDIVRYLSLTAILGERFADMPWAKETLSQKSVAGTQSRMDRLYQRALEELDKEPER